MDELLEKTEALLKSLLSMKTEVGKDLMVPALKAPSMKVSKPSIKQPSLGKIPSGLPPPSKKDPAKVAEQLKHPQPGKVKVEVLKVEGNGQWSLDKGVSSEYRQGRKNIPRWDQPHAPAEPNIFSSLPSKVPGKEVFAGTPKPGEEKVRGLSSWHARNDDEEPKK